MSVVLTKEPLSGTMHGRGGFPVKTLIYAVFILFLVYMFYIYNSSQNNLREAEMTGSRYKREAEERVTEIQELVRAKDRFQETCQNEKTELHTRIKSLNQQYSMVQSQYKETEADFIKLRQDMDTVRAEHAQSDTSHAAEYEKLKQDKENQVAKLKDDVADLSRQNENLVNTITNLRLKVKEGEDAFQGQKEQYQSLEQNFITLQNTHKQILDQNAQLQQLLQNRPQLPTREDQQNLPHRIGVTQQPLDKQEHMQIDGQGVTSFRVQHPSQLGIDDQGHEDHGQVDNKEDAKQVADEEDSLNQVRPPNNNNIDDDGVRRGFNDVNIRADVNPNDEQKVQILQPVFEPNDKHQGGGEDGVVAMNIRREEEMREKNVKDEEDDTLHHNNPLALGQIEVPGQLNDLDDAAGQNKKNQIQQLPPLLNDENDKKDQDRQESHYFGEDEDAQQHQQQQEEEEDHDEADDFDNNAERFPDNQANKDAALADANNN